EGIAARKYPRYPWIPADGTEVQREQILLSQSLDAFFGLIFPASVGQLYGFALLDGLAVHQFRDPIAQLPVRWVFLRPRPYLTTLHKSLLSPILSIRGQLSGYMLGTHIVRINKQMCVSKMVTVVFKTGLSV